MCTLSWLPASDGYAVWLNRDELRSRRAGLPPVAGERNGVRYLAPVDGERGGTWIGVNDRGITLCLVNRYPEAPGTGIRVSRGLLLVSLLDTRSREEALLRVAGQDLAGYAPFTIACFEPGRPVLTVTFSGGRLDVADHDRTGMVLTSSSFDQAAAEVARQAVFFNALAGSGRGDDSLLTRLHASHEPAAGAMSICMHRDDAETVSLTRITVRPDTVEIGYRAGSPCQGGPDIQRELPRRPARAGAPDGGIETGSPTSVR